MRAPKNRIRVRAFMDVPKKPIDPAIVEARIAAFKERNPNWKCCEYGPRSIRYYAPI